MGVTKRQLADNKRRVSEVAEPIKTQAHRPTRTAEGRIKADTRALADLNAGEIGQRIMDYDEFLTELIEDYGEAAMEAGVAKANWERHQAIKMLELVGAWSGKKSSVADREAWMRCQLTDTGVEGQTGHDLYMAYKVGEANESRLRKAVGAYQSKLTSQQSVLRALEGEINRTSVGL